MLTPLNFSAFAEADGERGFYTPWMRFPASHQIAEYCIDCKSHDIGGVDITLESSIDGDATQVVSGHTQITAAGLTRSEFTEKHAPLVRLKLVQDAGGNGGVKTAVRVARSQVRRVVLPVHLSMSVEEGVHDACSW